MYSKSYAIKGRFRLDEFEREIESTSTPISEINPERAKLQLLNAFVTQYIIDRVETMIRNGATRPEMRNDLRNLISSFWAYWAVEYCLDKKLKALHIHYKTFSRKENIHVIGEITTSEI